MVDSPLRSVPATFEPDSYYKVEIKTPFEHGNRWHRPGEDVRLRGDIAQQFRDSLTSAIKVDPGKFA